MKNHEKVQAEQPLTAGEIFEFVAAVVEQLPRNLDPVKVRWYNEKKSRIGNEVRSLFAREVPIPTFDIVPWQDFFRRVLGREVDFTNLHVPEKPKEGNWRAIVNPRIFTNNELYDACAKRFQCWRYTEDMNTVQDIVSRPRGPYVVWVRDTQEADEDQGNRSANDIKERGLNTETLTERLLHELKYYDETVKHLDVQNWTFCAGSRYSDGGVPSVGWDGDSLGVGWCDPGNRRDRLRARVAVS